MLKGKHANLCGSVVKNSKQGITGARTSPKTSTAYDDNTYQLSYHGYLNNEWRSIRPDAKRGLTGSSIPVAVALLIWRPFVNTFIISKSVFYDHEMSPVWKTCCCRNSSVCCQQMSLLQEQRSLWVLGSLSAHKH